MMNIDINATLNGENFLSEYDSYDNDFNEEERDNVNTFFGSLVGGKVSNMVAEMRELIFTELGKVFPNLYALASEIMINVSHGDSLNDKRKLSLDRRYGSLSLNYIFFQKNSLFFNFI